MSAPMRLSVNGQTRQLEPGSSLLDLLAALELDPRTVVVEDGDAVELVHFVGGG